MSHYVLTWRYNDEHTHHSATYYYEPDAQIDLDLLLDNSDVEYVSLDKWIHGVWVNLHKQRR